MPSMDPNGSHFMLQCLLCHKAFLSHSFLQKAKPSLRRQLQFGQPQGYPEPLPTTTKHFIAREPYAKIMQGKRVNKDVRVFRKSFTYPASMDGHRVTCDNSFDCKITYMAIDTDKGIPIILRGGAGYQHFTVVVRSRPGDPLVGTISAYCVKNEHEEAGKIIGKK